MSVAATYAEALYQAAADKARSVSVASDLDALADALGADSDVARVLNNPKVDSRVPRRLRSARSPAAPTR